jgi:hypothetical protein
MRASLCYTYQAINRMKEQPAGGHVFNMDGAGADGNATPRFAAYGATKRSLQQVGCPALWWQLATSRTSLAGPLHCAEALQSPCR